MMQFILCLKNKMNNKHQISLTNIQQLKNIQNIEEFVFSLLTLNNFWYLNLAHFKD